MLRKIVLLITSGLALFIVFYTSQQGYKYSKNINAQFFGENNFIINYLDEVIYEIDLRRIMRQFLLNNNQYLDLKLSRSDLDHLQNSKDLFIDMGYISDSENTWRNAEILVEDSLEKMSFKLHGTSVSPLIRGGLSLRIKHKKSANNYFKYARDFKLITAYDEADITTIVLNNLAFQSGLISPSREFVTLRINGNDLGLYQFEEHHSKEWFERKIGLTQFSLIKSSDDWNRKEVKAHISNSDLWIQNKEVKSSADGSVAMGALDALLKAVRGKDIDLIKNAIDLDYVAKFVAFYSIINNNHPVTGDNLKYIYDHTRGKFLFLFRLEDQLVPLNDSIEEFSSSWLFSPNTFANSDTHEIFKILLRDEEFISLKNKYLYEIVERKEDLISQAENIYAKNINSLKYNTNKIPRHKIVFQKEEFFKNLERNILIAEKYLNYEKVFITAVNKEETTNLEILNDSYHDLILESINLISPKKDIGLADTIAEQNTLSLSLNAEIYQSKLDENFQQIIQPQSLSINSNKEISNLIIKNKISKKIIQQKNIYLNYKKDMYLSSNKDLSDILILNNVEFEFIDENQVKIKSGEYYINQDLIFPDNFSVIMENGTNFRLGKNISILIKGSLIALGTKEKPITFRPLTTNEPFGVVAIIGNNKEALVNLSHFEISGGSEATIEGINFLGQLSIHYSNFYADNISVKYSFSDDGMNVRNSKVNIRNSNFSLNAFDQVDLDFCEGQLESNDFKAPESIKKMEDLVANGDGLDLSGSKVILENNSFEGFADKALSVGEESMVLLNKNDFLDNLNALAIKDGSTVFALNNNSFKENINDFYMFTKKSFFPPPMIYISNKSQKIKLENGFINNIDEELIIQSFKNYGYKSY